MSILGEFDYFKEDVCRSEFQQFKWSHDRQQKATAVWMLAKSFASTSGKVKNAIKNCMIVESRSGVSGCPTKMRYVSVENMWKHKHETLGFLTISAVNDEKLLPT